MKDGWKEESPAGLRRGQKGKGDCSLRKSELQAECPKQAEVSITHACTWDPVVGSTPGHSPVRGFAPRPTCGSPQPTIRGGPDEQCAYTPSKTPAFPVHQLGNSAHHFLKSPKGHVSSLRGQFYYLGAFGGSHLTVCIWTFMASMRFLHSQGHPRSQNGGL